MSANFEASGPVGVDRTAVVGSGATLPPLSPELSTPVTVVVQGDDGDARPTSVDGAVALESEARE
jgi:hypothetical protein